MPLFSRLDVWQKAHTMVLEVYQLTSSFPDAERYGIVSQLRRAAFSVPANIAEGQRRNSPKDFAHFLDVALGSLAEVQYFALLSRDLQYMTDESYAQLSLQMDEIERMLTAFVATLRTK